MGSGKRIMSDYELQDDGMTVSYEGVEAEVVEEG